MGALISSEMALFHQNSTTLRTIFKRGSKSHPSPHFEDKTLFKRH